MGAYGDLLDRKNELDVLRSALVKAGRGEGQCVLVSGSAGIGKSRLLDAAGAMATESPEAFRVLRGRCGQFERATSWALVREVLAQVADEDSVFHGVAARARDLVTGPGHVVASEPADADAAFAMVHAVHWAVANLAQTSPLVLLLDDVQWADPATLRWLAHLIPRVRELSLMLVMARRDGDPDELSALEPALASSHLDSIRPRVLGLDAVTALVRAACRDGAQPPSYDVCRAVLACSAGNPFLVRGLATGLAAIAQPSEADVRALAVDGVARMTRSTLAGLGTLCSTVAQVIAMTGHRAAPVEVAGVLDLTVGTVDRCFDRLATAGLVVREQRDRVAFVHPLVREAIVDSLPPGQRSELSRTLALVLHRLGAPHTRIASQLMQVHPAADPWVVEMLVASAREATTDGALEGAVDLLARALEEPPSQDARPDVLMAAGWAAYRAFDPRAIAWLSEGAALTGDVDRGARAHLALLNAASALQVPWDSKPLLDLAVRASDSVLLEIEGWARIGEGFYVVPVDVGDWKPREHGDLAGDTRAERVWLTGLLLNELVSGRSSERMRVLADRVVAGDPADEHQDMVLTASAMRGLITVGDMQRANDYCSRAVLDAARRGSLMGFQQWSAMSARVHLAMGQVGAAAEEAAQGLGDDEPHGWVIGHAWCAGILAAARMMSGDLGGAAAALAGVGLATAEPPETVQGIETMMFRARLSLLRGDLDLARLDLDRSHAWLRAAGWLDTVHHPWRPVAADVAWATGDREEARTMAREHLEHMQTFGAAHLVGAAHRKLGETLADTDVAAEHLRAAVQLLADSDAALEHSRALLALGGHLRRNRAPADAREPLLRGLDMATRLGAGLVVARARTELAAAGVRPRRSSLTGPDALTASERRVVDQAVTGLSNPEIAQALFVSRKTVEKHLSAAYLKLGVNARKELAAALANQVHPSGAAATRRGSAAAG